jgi:hypothetical protein
LTGTPAREIDRLAETQEARAKAWQDLAVYARQPDADRRQIERRRHGNTPNFNAS